MIEDVLRRRSCTRSSTRARSSSSTRRTTPIARATSKLSFHAVEGFQPPAAVELAATGAPDVVVDPPAPTE
jgi:hypothetical protein